LLKYLRRPEILRALTAGAIVGLVTVVVHNLGWFGGDIPGDFLRVEMFRQGHYWRIPAWFGGFPNVTYSFLLPPLGSLIGVSLMMCIAAAVATVGVARLTERTGSRRSMIAAASFGVAMVATVAVGRAPYSLGTAFGAWTLFWLGKETRHGDAMAVVLAVLTGLSSPVAGLFLGMLAAGFLLERVRRSRIVLLALIGIGGVGPSFLANRYFGTGGGLPCSWATALTVAALFAVYAFATDSLAVRISALLGIGVCFVVGAFNTPLTYIIKRLPETSGGSVAAATLSKRLGAALIVFLAGWNVLSIRSAAVESGHGERTGAAFGPLINDLAALHPTGAVEVVPTRLHWETWYVARTFPIARGWERQADIDHGPQFYTNEPFTADVYRDWLIAEGVQYVALSDLKVDDAGKYEAELLAQPLPYLTKISDAGHWTVWRFDLAA
jgi:hypothetical protein